MKHSLYLIEAQVVEQAESLCQDFVSRSEEDAMESLQRLT